jgi:predicted transcriptional regulator
LTALEEGIEDAKKGNLVKHETILDEWEGKAGVV